MEKTCFECGIKGEALTGPIFSPAEKLRAFYLELGVSDPIIEKMQDGELLCTKCSSKAECRHALKFYNYYQEKWAPEQYEIWAKNNAELISIAETELKEPEKKDSQNLEITPRENILYDARGKSERLAIIEGNPTQNGQSDSTGHAIINGDLATKFEAFCAAHKGKIIDWNVSPQSDSGNWSIFIRYVD
ncbi:MAG TPA: hypothetical protein VMW74_07140 [Nitrosopumilaceae archaeon]|nr:hypothetical protein [Nitrosopumilaceae archaeon]